MNKETFKPRVYYAPILSIHLIRGIEHIMSTSVSNIADWEKDDDFSF